MINHDKLPSFRLGSAQTDDCNNPAHTKKIELTAEQIEEEKESLRQSAIKTLSGMCLEDDDMAIVVVVSPYRRLKAISLILDGTNTYYGYENKERLADAIRGTEVERFIFEYFVTPEVNAAIERCDRVYDEYGSKAIEEAYGRGKSDEFDRIVNLLKGGEHAD